MAVEESGKGEGGKSKGMGQPLPMPHQASTTTNGKIITPSSIKSR